MLNYKFYIYLLLAFISFCPLIYGYFFNPNSKFLEFKYIEILPLIITILATFFISRVISNLSIIDEKKSLVYLEGIDSMIKKLESLNNNTLSNYISTLDKSLSKEILTELKIIGNDLEFYLNLYIEDALKINKDMYLNLFFKYKGAITDDSFSYPDRIQYTDIQIENISATYKNLYESIFKIKFIIFNK
jgi:hypothetical protein